MSDIRYPLRPEPDKFFFALEDGGWTFAEVDRYVALTCETIIGDTALKPGDRVAILMPAPVPFALTMLALMRMRVVSVPLSTRLTASELAWQVKNADCRLVICTADARAQTSDMDAPIFELPTMTAHDRPSDFDGWGTLHFDDDFAIIHTSGTTGKPKAAVLTVGNIHHSAIDAALSLEIRRNARWLCVLPLYHVGGLSIILRSLICGTAVEFGPTAPFDVHETNRVLSDNPITIVSLVPTMLGRLLDAKRRAWNPRLRLILLGGEAPSAELLARCAAEDLPIATCYGMTETASQVVTALPALVYQKMGAVGKAMMTAKVRIIDEKGDKAATNAPGEVLVKGGSVMRGYYNDTAATAKALRDGWLHTGDIGYLDEDGDLFILQRREDLIISGGENIYPAEVEAALREHPAVEEAVALGLADAQWGQRVAAVVELRAGRSATSDDIIAFARRRLAGYKIPQRIAFVAELPRTAAGKVRRREARSAFDDASDSDA